MNLEKLKDTARKLEQKEDWRKAIEVYLKAIQQAESGAESTPDLSLYNRVGDLYLKINDTAEAVRSYERAVDLYADQGFFNNAIALCGKILRVNPGRTQTYLKLAQLHARKNVVIEAKRNLIEFLERMNALGQLDQAFQAVKLFADQFSGSQEIRSMLVDLLRATSREDEAREQLEKMAVDLETIGDKAGARKTRERISTIETEQPPTAPLKGAGPARRGDLIFLDTGVDISTPGEAAPPPVNRRAAPESLVEEKLVPSPEPIDDLITEPSIPDPPADQADSVLGIQRIEDSLYGGTVDLDAPLEITRQEPPDLTFDSVPLEGMEETTLSAFGQPSPLDDYMVSLPDGEPTLEVPSEKVEPLVRDFGDVQFGIDKPASAGGRPFVPDEDAPARTIAELEDRVLDDPENPDVHLAMANGLVAAGETGRVAEELELALAGFEDREDWVRAAEMADRLVELAPDSVTYHQKRVELAYRAGDRGPLIEAYLGLGDALAKSDALDKAIAVYGRVIEHDPRNAQAAAALKRLGAGQPEEPPPPPPKPKQSAPPPKPPPVAPAPSPQASRTAPPKEAPVAPAPRTPPPAPAKTPAPAKPPSRAPAAAGDFV
ncbi:MAG TPA: tetratricopeptide repeat protein, partial [Gemmatimonadales bacterium]|nr:tetratricopeptide repeat protein [Gemmatimonadales bacterium]